MKFQDLLKNVLLEQQDPDEEPMDFDDDDGNNPEVDPNIDLHGGDGFDDDEPMIDVDGNEIDQPHPQERRPERLSATQQIKLKWAQDNPGVTDFEMDDAIGFFRARRDSLRPYHPYGYVDPETNRHYINSPELTTIVERFPHMTTVLSRPNTMRDLKNYPWEVMNFYMDIVRTTNDIIDEENIVAGTQLPLNQQLEFAKEKWNSPRNRIMDEGGLIVYKIESQNESILYGSIQRVLNLIRKKQGNSRGNAYWCTTVPLNDKGRSNLWTNYRPVRAFYYLWDQNKNETDDTYCGSIQTIQPGAQGGPYTFVNLYNHTDTDLEWSDLVEKYPQLHNKQRLFPYFGTTSKEKQDLTVDKITLTPGGAYYFGTIPQIYQRAYVESGRHVRKVKAFLTMDASLRKLYVDKTTKENNDLSTRFLCDDPNNPFGILEILRLETKPENLYKYLDNKILKSNLEVLEGILAIKKLIIGNNWRRFFSDVATNYTLITKDLSRDPRHRPTYGLMDIDNTEIIKPPNYKASPVVRSFLYRYTDDNGIQKYKRYMWQRYDYITGDGNPDPNEYFYFLFLQDATKPSSDIYLQGKMYEGREGDAFIQNKLATGEFKRM